MKNESDGFTDGYVLAKSLNEKAHNGVQSPKAKQKGEAHDTMRSHVHQCMRETLRPLVDRIVASENHIEKMAAELIQGRERDVVLEEHVQAIDKLEASVGKIMANLDDVQNTLGSNFGAKIARVEKEGIEKLAALRSGFDTQLSTIQQVIEKSKSDILKLQASLADSDKHVAKIIEPAITQQRADHQKLTDLYEASERVHAETKKFGEKTRRNLQALKEDVDTHKEETFTNFQQHVQERMEGLAESNKFTDDRQNTMSEHLKTILTNARITRTKMEQVHSEHEEQINNSRQMRKDIEKLFEDGRVLGKEVNSMLGDLKDSKQEVVQGSDLAQNAQFDQMKAEAKEAKAQKERQAAEHKANTQFSGITKAIADIAKQVKDNSKEIQTLADLIQENASGLEKCNKRTGQSERLFSVVEVKMEKTESAVQEVLNEKQSMLSQIVSQERQLISTGHNLEKTTAEVQALNHSTKNLNDSVGKLHKDVGLAHDYFNGLKTGFNETVVGELLPSTEKKERSAAEALAAMPAPAASFARPRQKLSKGNSTAR